jgi:UDP-N-acetyl-2-amino-2-deoxyglucuronate dehydrogenase
VLQLRLHPSLVAFRERLRAQPDKRHAVELAYLTARGRWYDVSWKGVDERSGGIVTNIGIHFFDLLVWLFGPVQNAAVHLRETKRAAGSLVLANADVRWYLSAESVDLPFPPEPGKRTTFRSITVDGEQLEFSEGFTDLHTRVYEEILQGRGFGVADARPSIELTHRIRHTAVSGDATAAELRAAVMPAHSVSKE